MLDLLGGDDADVALLDADGAVQLSYAELRQRAEQLAGGLPRRAGQGLVLVYAANDVATVVRLFGAWAAGHAVLLADPSLPDDARGDLERQYDPDVVLGAGPEERRGAAGAPPVADGLRLVLSTSGSTGSAKGVRLSGAAVRANARAIATALRIDPSHRAAANLPFHYTYGLSVLLSHLSAGASVVLTTASPVQRGYVDTLEAAGVTSLAGVPYTYALLERAGFFERPPATLLRMTQAGGRLAPDAVTRISTALAAGGRSLWVMYGQTEACARMAVLPPREVVARPGAVGWPVPGGSFRIERAGSACAPGDVGEVVYLGPNVMWGYCHGRSDLARGDDLGGVLHTGDIGHVDADGCLWLAGRASRFAKLAGVRVSLDDLERLVSGLGDVAAVAEAERVRLHVTNADPIAHRDVVRALARHLRLHHSLFVVEAHDDLPRTPRGKVDYESLRRAAESR